MSKRNLPPDPNEFSENEPKSSGPNIWVLYVFLVLALLAAMGVAALIVRPFYQRL